MVGEGQLRGPGDDGQEFIGAPCGGCVHVAYSGRGVLMELHG